MPKDPIPFVAWLNQEFFIGYFISFDRLLLDKLRENDLLSHLPSYLNKYFSNR